MKLAKHALTEVEKQLRVQRSFILHCIQCEWIQLEEHPSPSVIEESAHLIHLDEEDMARLKLILELKDDFGVNDEAVPIILHLIDQLYTVLHHTKNRVQAMAKSTMKTKD